MKIFRKLFHLNYLVIRFRKDPHGRLQKSVNGSPWATYTAPVHPIDRRLFTRAYTSLDRELAPGSWVDSKGDYHYQINLS